MTRVEIALHPVQKAFLDSPAVYRGFVGGRGSGKTTIGAIDLLLRAMGSDGGRLYGMYAPDYPSLRDATWRAALEWGERFRCIRRVNLADFRIILGNGSEIIGRSLSDPNRARGPNLSGAWMDEASQVSVDAYHALIACLRERGERGWLSATFTPKGKGHWTYEVFSRQSPDVALFHSRLLDNPFRPQGFYEALAEQYPSWYARQELDGEFIDPPGAVFRREWFRVVDSAPEGLRWVRYWDLAASTKESADYTASVAVAMGPDGTVYLRDMIRGRWEWPDQERVLVQTMMAEPNVEHGVEKALHGIAAVQSLLRRPELAAISFHGVPAERDKLTRALPLAARAEQGKVALVRGEWIGAFLDEAVAFTGEEDAHDDQIDSAAGGLRMLMTPRAVEFAPSIWG